MISRRARRSACLLATTAAALTSVTAFGLSVTSPAQAATTAAPGSQNVGPFVLTWSKMLNDPGKPIAGSSPAVATLDAGGPSVVVSDRAGKVYAFHLSNGSTVAGWPASTGGIAVDATASVTGTGSSARVFVGVGNPSAPSKGGYLKLTNTGKTMFFVHPHALPGARTQTAGVQASLAVGILGGQQAVVAGAMGQLGYEINTSTGAVAHGWPWFQADTSFSTPALANLYGRGNVIIEGGDSTAGKAFGQTYTNGGHLRIIKATGHAGSSNPTHGLICQFNTDQVVQSSPAVGPILTGGVTGITFGTGAFYGHALGTNTLYTIDDQCNRRWAVKLDGLTTSSPAIADIHGHGALDVIEGTRAGSVYAIHAVTGHVYWHTKLPHPVYGSVVTASLNGVYQDVIVPTLGGVYVLDGVTGKVLYHLATSVGMQNAPLVTVDGSGQVGLTVAGYEAHSGHLYGVLRHYVIAGAPAALVHSRNSWPQFHHDAKLSGTIAVNPDVTAAKHG